MKKYFIILLLLSGLAATPAVLHAESPAETFDRANTAYYKNQLQLAKQLYEKLLGQGITSGHLFYNSGNVFYRQSQFGEALQYYEKAIRYLPRNADVRANLKFVEKKKIDRLEEPFWISFFRIFFFWHTYFTLKELIIALTLLSASMWMMAWLYLISRKNYLKWGAGTLLIVSLILGASVWFKYDQERLTNWAVVLKPEIDVRPTYLEQGKSLLKLHEGTMVEIIGSQKFGDADSWAQIKLPRGQKGWVKLENLGII